MSIRMAASACQVLQVMAAPRGARMVRARGAVGGAGRGRAGEAERGDRAAVRAVLVAMSSPSFLVRRSKGPPRRAAKGGPARIDADHYQASHVASLIQASARSYRAD